MSKMDNKIFLYHGAISVVNEPLTRVGRADLDFGPGFYVTNDRDQAIKWAKTKAGRKKGAKAILNIYSFDLYSFGLDNNFKKLVFKRYDVQWLDFVAYSRRGQQPWAGLDWIEGGIANDSVISTVEAYVDGMITPEKALDQLVHEDLKHQVCISNQDIIDKYLSFVETIEC